jgi:HEPN domain-containing protein
MTSEEKYAYWLQLAQYDLDTANTMHSGGRWFYVAFMCQQALEKLCKGLYNFYIDDDVPKVHNIGLIAKKLETALSITFSTEVYSLIDVLSGLYLNNRYPDFKEQSAMKIDKTRASSLLTQTEEAFKWLLTLKK